MLAGCQLISGYQNATDANGTPIRVPVYHNLYWMNLLSAAPDDALYNDVATIARAPIIEFDFARSGTEPSHFMRRSANLPSQIVPFDDKVLGITPVWAGAPDMGFPYQ